MDDAYKPREVLVHELEALRRRLAELQASEAREAWARAERALRQSEERFRELFENAPIAVLTVDATGRVTGANRGAEELTRYPRRELLKLTLDRLAAEAHRPRVAELLARGPEGTQALELDLVTKDGRAVPIEIAARALPPEGDNPGELHVVARDLSAGGARQRRAHVLFEAAPAAIAQMDAGGRIVEANRAWLELTGHGPGDLAGRRLTDFIPRGESAALVAEFQALVEGRRARCRVESRIVTSDGAILPVNLSLSVVREGETDPPRFVALLDPAPDRPVEQRLRQENERLAQRIAALEQRTREISLVSETGDLLQACRSAEEAYAVIARMGAQLFPGESGAVCVAGASSNLVEAVAAWGMPPGERLFSPEECWGLRRGRAHVVEDLTVGPTCRHMHAAFVSSYLCVPMMAHGETLGLLNLSAAEPGGLTDEKQRLAVAVAEHIALALANLRLRESLSRQSIRDPLTGLFNRRYMEESLEREMRRAGRGRHPVGIIMLDLDHFKQFNDTHGHEAGDNLLREVGAILQRSIRAADIACRYGGEEFTLILPEASLADATQRAEQIREAIRNVGIVHRRQAVAPVTVSLGVAIYPDHGPTGDAVLRAADAALYQAKACGRDRVAVSGGGGPASLTAAQGGG
jgi:diguanylate cyclase (GGDEF)-like protein/PAS domain S-box-containing protein